MNVAAVPAGARGRTAAVVPADPLDLVPQGAVVAVAMSGGVDSSVAAARCVEGGLRTVGVTLAMWPRDRERDRDRGCCSVDAVEDARRVCATLGIPHYAWNLEAEFHAEVVADFEEEYAGGRTPNPCVRCNERVKFGVLLERALAAGATHLATGHYARLGRRGEAATLHRGLDPGKDQAYTLCRVGQQALRRAVLPIGGFATKASVRELAASLGLVTAAKPDSQELCFVEGRTRDHLAARLRGRFAPGPVVDEQGAELGEHPGLPFVTVGQRSGLGLRPSRPDSLPLHVLRLDAGSNRVVVGPRERLATRSVAAVGCAWVDGPPAAGAEVSVQLRAHGAAEAATVISASAERVNVITARPLSATAPGQSLVLYDGDEVLGGGLVTSS